MVPYLGIVVSVTHGHTLLQHWDKVVPGYTESSHTLNMSLEQQQSAGTNPRNPHGLGKVKKEIYL